MTITQQQPAPRPVMDDERREIFLRVTGGLSRSKERWKERAATGLTDDELEQALVYEFGIEGGGGGPNSISYWYRRAGLKIWASWENACPQYRAAPFVGGKATVRMAREIYGIPDPDDDQLSLF